MFVFKAKKGITEIREWTFKRKDGSVFPVNLGVTALKNDKNEIIGFLGVVNDITEKKKYEEELLKANLINKDLFDNAPLGYHSLSKEGIYLNINQTELNWLGYSHEEVVGKLNFRNLVHPDYTQVFLSTFREFLKKGYAHNIELKLVRKDGSVFPVLVNSTAIYDHEGNYLRSRGTITDISKQKEFETKLVLANQTIYDLFNKAPVGYHSLSSDATFLSINQTELDWLGYKEEEVVKKLKFSDILTEKSKELFVQKTFEIFKKTGVVKDLEFECIRKDGTVFPILVNATAIYDEDGNYLRSRSTILDITERKNYENQLQANFEELNIFNQELHLSNSKLENLNQIKDKLFSIISHDLRSPLNSLKGVLFVLNYGGFSLEEQAVIFSVLNSQVENLSTLLDNLFHWAKTQMEGMKYSPQKIDIYTLIFENIELANPLAKLKQITIIHPEKKELLAFADDDMIRLVVRNLLNNAIKFTKSGGEISIRYEITHPYIRISVTDNGLGMNEIQLSKLFKIEDHFTLPGTAKEKGTGLGLLLCKEFVEKNGGKIWAESLEDQGSTFHFTLPVNTT